MKLHDYQEYAVKFIEEHPVSALLLDMGLGKTIITLTAINNLMFDMFEVRKVLIIAPLRVARDTWPAEIEKWEHLKHLRLKLYYLELKTFKQIAAEIRYSEKQIKRIHDKAVHNLDELLKKCPEMSANVQKCPLNVHW